MNALELADDAKNISNAIEALEWVQKSVPMLRQQQAEIEKLKQTIDANNLSQNIGQFVKPAKTLTDEEIIQLYEDMLGVASAKSSAIDFARAILRKAQEKC